ncbi:MAG: ribbon-helix-helix protein, CopG family [Hyphomicrobium sp.]|nr:ribbon-helix-helix protein, CopG family [Hyphomicrobium sp.]
MSDWNERQPLQDKRNRKLKLPPSRGVLVLLPLNLIDVLDQAAETLNMSRSDIIRRSLIREVTSVLRDEVMRMRARAAEQERQTLWSR